VMALSLDGLSAGVSIDREGYVEQEVIALA
jgi:hypothetical protein